MARMMKSMYHRIRERNVWLIEQTIARNPADWVWAVLPRGRKVYISHSDGMPDRAYGTKNDSEFRGSELAGHPLGGAPPGTYFCVLCEDEFGRKDACVCDVLSSTKIDIDTADVMSRISTVQGIEGLKVADYRLLGDGGIYEVARKMTKDSGGSILLMSRHDVGSFSALSGAIWKPPHGDGAKVLEISRDGRAIAVKPLYKRGVEGGEDDEEDADPSLKSRGDWLDYCRVDVGPVFNYDPSTHEERRRYVCFMCTSSGERGWVVSKPARQSEPLSLFEYIDCPVPMEGPRMFRNIAATHSPLAK